MTEVMETSEHMGRSTRGRSLPPIASEQLFDLAQLGRIDELEALYKTYGDEIFGPLDSNSRCLLHVAASAGRVSVCDWILSREERVFDLADDNGMTAFHYAAHAGQFQVIDYLCKLEEEEPVVQYAIDNNGWTAVMMAAAEDKIDILRYLIEIRDSEDDVSLWLSVTRDKQFGGTALHWAAAKGRLKAVQVLLKYGTNVYTKSFSGASAADLAAQCGHEEVVKYLMEWMDRTTIFFNLIRSNELNELKLLFLEQPAEMKVFVDIDHRSGLHIATEAGNYEIVKWMQINGWDLDKRDFFERSALHWAALNARGRISELLIAGGCDIDAESGTKLKPATTASQMGLNKLASAIVNRRGWDEARDECDTYVSLFKMPRDPTKDEASPEQTKKRHKTAPSNLSGSTVVASASSAPATSTVVPAAAVIPPQQAQPQSTPPVVAGTTLVQSHGRPDESPPPAPSTDTSPQPRSVPAETKDVASPPKLPTDLSKVTVKLWLESIDMGEYVKGLYDEGYDSFVRVSKFDDDLLSSLNVKRGHRRKIMAELPGLLKFVAPVIREYEAGVASLQVADSLAKWMQVLDLNSIKETLEAEGFDSPGSVVLLTTDDLQDMKIKPAYQRHLLEIIKLVSSRKNGNSPAIDSKDGALPTTDGTS